MTDYGRGSALSAATALPATSGAGILMAQHAHPAIVMALLVISAISFIVLLGSISRFVINNNRAN